MADHFVELLIAVIGFYFAHSLSRQVVVRVSEKRLGAYAALWDLTRVASPTRLRGDGAGPLTPAERTELHDQLLGWYYNKGNGMLLADGTRTMFLKVKDNLYKPPEELEPKSFREEVRQAGDDRKEAIRGERAIDQLSLLRTRMKADLGVFGIHYGGNLTDNKKAFLTYCGEQLWRRPWRKPLGQYVREFISPLAREGTSQRLGPSD